MSWGTFKGRVITRWLDNGRDMALVEPFAYLDPATVRWDAPAGAIVNGASIPQAFWSVIGSPFTGRFRNASVVHDVACVERSRPWPQVHRMFYEACRCGRTNVVQAKIMYYAVYNFGPRWRADGRELRFAEAPTPSPADVRRIIRWFKTHDIDAAAIPNLSLQ